MIVTLTAVTITADLCMFARLQETWSVFKKLEPSLQVPHSDEAADGVVVSLLELEPDVAGDDLAVGLLDGRPAGRGGGRPGRPRLVDRPAKEVDGAALLGAPVESFGLRDEA